MGKAYGGRTSFPRWAKRGFYWGKSRTFSFMIAPSNMKKGHGLVQFAEFAIVRSELLIL
jgi:hypothetical protein